MTTAQEAVRAWIKAWENKNAQPGNGPGLNGFIEADPVMRDLAARITRLEWDARSWRNPALIAALIRVVKILGQVAATHYPTVAEEREAGDAIAEATRVLGLQVQAKRPLHCEVCPYTGGCTPEPGGTCEAGQRRYAVPEDDDSEMRDVADMRRAVLWDCRCSQGSGLTACPEHPATWINVPRIMQEAGLAQHPWHQAIEACVRIVLSQPAGGVGRWTADDLAQRFLALARTRCHHGHQTRRPSTTTPGAMETHPCLECCKERG